MVLASTNASDSAKLVQEILDVRYLVREVRSTDSIGVMDVVNKLFSYGKRNELGNYLAWATYAGFEFKQGRKKRAYFIIDSLLASESGKNKPLFKLYGLRIKAGLLQDDGFYTESLNYYYKALPIAENLHDDRCVMIILLNIGLSYQTTNNYKESITLLYRLFAINSPKIIDSHNYCVALNNIGYDYLCINELDSAYKYLTLAKEFSRTLKGYAKEQLFNFASSNLGELLCKQKKYGQALPYLLLDQQFSFDNHEWDSYIITAVNLINCYQGLGRISDAYGVIQKVDSITKLPNVSIYHFSLFLACKASFLAERGDYHNAYLVQVLHDSLYTTLTKSEIANKAVYLKKELEYESAKQKAIENQEKMEELGREKLGLILGIFVFVLLLILGGILLRRQRRLTKVLQLNNEIIAHQNEASYLDNEKLKQLLNQKSRILGVVSHDLKAPFNRVSGLLELMKLDASNNEKYESLIQRCVQEGKTLINDLLETVGLEENKRALSITEFELTSLVDNLLLGFSIQAKAKDITVEKLYNTNHPILMASDSFAISRVLDNLLSNALKFSESNSSIQVQILSISENSTQITIKDEGPGIGAEEITQLFVPFSKGKAQPTAGEKSTGLGLSIVYHLVKLLMGTIEVDSKLGAGATFIITIPNRIEA